MHRFPPTRCTSFTTLDGLRIAAWRPEIVPEAVYHAPLDRRGALLRLRGLELRMQQLQDECSEYNVYMQMLDCIQISQHLLHGLYLASQLPMEQRPFNAAEMEIVTARLQRWEQDMYDGEYDLAQNCIDIVRAILK